MSTTYRPIIGLIGKKRSGKDSFAAPLVAELGFTRVAFADPLRDAALRLDPIIDHEAAWADEGGINPAAVVRLSTIVRAIGWEAAKDRYPEVRRTLERLGTDAIRTLDPDFWIRQAEALITCTDAPVVVTDVRFPNEAAKIRELGGTLVRVVRPEQEIAADAHLCETALDDFQEDVTAINGGELVDLHNFARTYATTLLAAARPAH